MQTFTKFLNPLHKDLDNVVNFSDVKDKTPLEQEEYPHLEHITKIKATEISFLLPKLQRLEEELEHQIMVIDTSTSQDEKMDQKAVYNQLLRDIERTVERINRELIALDSPYFGKISFLPYDSKTNNPLQLYVGKFALVDEKTHIPLITDWRSPISNIYYQNSGPAKDVEYEAPIGIRKGDLLQKRQFQIARARIRGIYDAKSGNAAADEFLLSQLNERLGKKLQDIVSTIQSQQNEIIREEINKPVLIQGVAGSGKTTILLHRLAYLFYTHKEISRENSLIIAPNQMFIDYVSDVLPNLGVEPVETLTYAFWAKKFLDWGDRYIVSSEDEDLKFKEFKGSVEFLNILDKYFEEFENTLLEAIPSSQKEIIRNRYYELKEQFPNIDMEERISLATEYAFAQKQMKNQLTGTFTDTFDLDLAKKKEIQAYFRKSCNTYHLYKNLYKTDLVSKECSKYSVKGLYSQNNYIYFRMEDLGPIVYLHQKIHSIKFLERDYVMVDEAQDLSFVQIATLAKIAKKGNITIAGDLAQAIISPFYIKDWDDVIQLVNNVTRKETSFHQLQRCYRTTVEIIEFANRMFKGKFPENYKLPEAVLRHGEEVKVFEDGLKKKELVELIKKEFDKGSTTVAVICRDKNHSTKIYNELKDSENYLERYVIDSSQNDYKDGLLILPVSSAKGLEFDSVILMDVNEKTYPDSELSIRLLYVAITRALHRLFIIK